MAEKSALIVIDMLNRYEHEDAEPLVASVREALPGIRRVIGRTGERDTPIVYVNDNYGDWSAGAGELCENGLSGRQRALVRDAVAHIHAELAHAALEMMRRNMRAEVLDSASVLPD